VFSRLTAKKILLPLFRISQQDVGLFRDQIIKLMKLFRKRLKISLRQVQIIRLGLQPMQVKVILLETRDEECQIEEESVEEEGVWVVVPLRDLLHQWLSQHHQAQVLL
jgi:hypothetical protein